MQHILKLYILIAAGLVLMVGSLSAQDDSSALSCPEEGPFVDLENFSLDPFERTDQGLYFELAGDESLLLPDSYPMSWARLSDDGERVAYIRNIWEEDADYARLEIWAMDTDGTDDRLLIGTDDLTSLREEQFEFTAGIVALEWIPGTHTLAFNSGATPLGEGIHISIADDLWTVDADTGELTNILPQGEGGEFHYAPDGEHVAVLALNEMRIMDADGGDQHLVDIADYTTIGMGHGYQYPHVTWPDAETLLVAVSTGDPYAASAGEMTMWRVSLDGTAEELSRFPAFNLSFTISPDSQWLAYWRTETQQSNVRDLHVASVDGSYDIVFTTSEAAEFVAWLSDDPGFFIYRESFDAPLELGHVCGAAYEMVED